MLDSYRQMSLACEERLSDHFSCRSCKNFLGNLKAAYWEVLRLVGMKLLDGSKEALDHLETPIHHLSAPEHSTSPTGQTSDKMDTKGITGSFNVNSFNKIINTTILDGKSQLLQWLSSLEPQRRHQHLRESRLKGVGKWIFQTTEFRRWNTTEDGSSHSVLFCHGDPGVGKTHLR